MPTLRDPLIDTSNISGGDIKYQQLPPGATLMEIVQGVLAPYTVWVEPATGDEVTVEYRVSAAQAWQAWPSGPVTAYAENRIRSNIHSIRFTSDGGATGSQCGVARAAVAEWDVA
jgi:hypothetical protein